MLSGRTYDEVCRNFKWEIPDYYNIAVYKLGAVAVQLLTLFGPEAIEYRLVDSQAKVVITDQNNLSKIDEISDRLPYLKLVMVIDGGRDEAVMDP